VKQGEVAMVVGEFREHYPEMHPPLTIEGLRLILGCGMVVLLNSSGTGERYDIIDLEPL